MNEQDLLLKSKHNETIIVSLCKFKQPECVRKVNANFYCYYYYYYLSFMIVQLKTVQIVVVIKNRKVRVVFYAVGNYRANCKVYDYLKHKKINVYAI